MDEHSFPREIHNGGILDPQFVKQVIGMDAEAAFPLPVQVALRVLDCAYLSESTSQAASRVIEAYLNQSLRDR